MACSKKPDIVFISGNAGKIREVRQILGDHYNVISEDIDLPEYQGDPDEIVVAKCKAALECCRNKSNLKTGSGIVIEDTSLCFNALGGMPGPYVKWFLKKAGTEALHRMLADFDDKSATALCVFAFCKPTFVANPDVKLFHGKIPGTIVKPRGSNDFGWDPIFEPTGYNQTFAEMPAELKNTISHRYKAVMAMKAYLDKEFVTENGAKDV